MGQDVNAKDVYGLAPLCCTDKCEISETLVPLKIY
jgi:hypothetical protein